MEWPFASKGDPKQHERGKEYAQLLSSLLAEGKLRSTPAKVVPNGLQDAQYWIDYQKDGKVSRCLPFFSEVIVMRLMCNVYISGQS